MMGFTNGLNKIIDIKNFLSLFELQNILFVLTKNIKKKTM